VSLEEVVARSECQNFVLAQASFEDGMSRLLAHLRQARTQYPGRQFLQGEAIWESTRDRADDRALDKMHRPGVRCLRVHGEFGNGGR
jgi:hypothetical protein